MTSGSSRVGSAFAFPTARHYGWLALGFLAFVVYGSLVPLDFRPLAIGEAIDRYRMAWQVPIRVESRSDWLSNILLFIPLGFLLSGWLAVDRSRRAVIAVAIAIPVASAILSAVIEFAQVYFPSRTVSPRDVAAETIGGTIGGALWLAAGPWLTWRARDRAADEGLSGSLLPAYLLALGLSHAMPLDLTISPGDIYHKYKIGMIQIIPYASVLRGEADGVRRTADQAVSFLIVGLMLGQAKGWRVRGPWAVFAVGLATAGCCEVLQLFVASRRFDVSDIVTGSLTVFAGWLAGRSILSSPASHLPGTLRGGSGFQLAFFSCWLGLVVASSWSPFDFAGDPEVCLEKLSALSTLPFADYYQGSVLNAADQIFRKAVLFLPLGMASGWRGSWTLLAAAGLAILIEAGQLVLPGRQPSITDILVETGGAWLGHVFARNAPCPARLWGIRHPSAVGE
jgi:VanZ family protein